jgi:hypothetical protein
MLSVISRILYQDDLWILPCMISMLNQLQISLAQKPQMTQYPCGSRDEQIQGEDTEKNVRNV